jgi:hypothetical protein
MSSLQDKHLKQLQSQFNYKISSLNYSWRINCISFLASDINLILHGIPTISYRYRFVHNECAIENLNKIQYRECLHVHVRTCVNIVLSVKGADQDNFSTFFPQGIKFTKTFNLTIT